MARYVLVADGGQARVLRTSGRAGPVHFQEVDRFERPSLVRGKKHRPLERHGTQSDFDPHAAEVLRFAKTVARKLDALRRANSVDEFVLLVEPKFLGELRPAMSKLTRALVSREVSRDFVHADDKRIERAAFPARS